MAKKLKIWNVRGWGRKDYDEDSPTYGQYLYPKAVSRIYICAHSRAHASRIMAAHLPMWSYFKDEPNAANHELKEYGSEGCWGLHMEEAGIEPEIGIWVAVGNEHHPEIKCIWKESDEQ